MKIKEERDVERQKRVDINPIHNGSVTITPTAHIKTESEWTKVSQTSRYLCCVLFFFNFVLLK